MIKISPQLNYGKPNNRLLLCEYNHISTIHYFRELRHIPKILCVTFDPLQIATHMGYPLLPTSNHVICRRNELFKQAAAYHCLRTYGPPSKIRKNNFAEKYEK